MLTAASLFRIAAALVGADPGTLYSRARDARTVRARMAVAWALRNRRSPPPSYPAIGRLLDRDHSSVIYLVRQADCLRDHDRSFRDLTDRLVSNRDGEPGLLETELSPCS